MFTDTPLKGAPKNEWYKDPFGVLGPYYYTDSEEEAHRHIPGWRTVFQDHPRRKVDHDVTWSARLWLVGVKVKGGTSFDKLVAINYGFQITGGHAYRKVLTIKKLTPSL